jgi:hypothetical protein
MRQIAPQFGISKSAADRIIGHLGPLPALQPRQRFRKDSMLIVDGTLVPTRDHAVAEQSENYRYSTAHQVVIDADTHLVVVVGRPLPGNRHDSRGWEESGAKAAVGKTMTIADGGYQGTGLVIPHRRRKGEELPAWKEAHNHSHKQVRARVEHTLARMTGWKILRDCPLRGDGVHHAILDIARPCTTSPSPDKYRGGAATDSRQFQDRYGTTLNPALLTEEVVGPRRLLLAGQSWQVTYIDWSRRRRFVEPVDGGGKAH